MPERNIQDSIEAYLNTEKDDAALVRRLRQDYTTNTDKLAPWSPESQELMSYDDKDLQEAIRDIRKEWIQARALATQGSLENRDAAAAQGGRNLMKSAAQAASWAPMVVPGLGAPAGLLSKVIGGALGAYDVYSNLDNPPDFMTSAASGALGMGLNKVNRSAPMQALFDKFKTGIPRILASAGVSGLEGAATAALPGLVRDDGIYAPDATTFEKAKNYGVLGAAFGGLTRGMLGSASNQTGTSEFNKIAREGLGSLAKPSEMNSQLAGNTMRKLALDRAGAKFGKVQKFYESIDDLSMRHKAALASGNMAGAAKLLSQKNKATGELYKHFGLNPQDIPPQLIESVRKSGGVKPLMNAMFDQMFRDLPGKADQNTMDSIISTFKGLRNVIHAAAPLGTTDKDKELKTAFLGYLLENFSNPGMLDQKFTETAGKAGNYITGLLFKDKNLATTFKQFTKAFQDVSKEEIVQNHGFSPRIRVGTGGMALFLSDMAYILSPRGIAEAIQRGKKPLLTSMMDAQNYLKTVRDNPQKAAIAERLIAKLAMDFGFRPAEGAQSAP